MAMSLGRLQLPVHHSVFCIVQQDSEMEVSRCKEPLSGKPVKRIVCLYSIKIRDYLQFFDYIGVHPGRRYQVSDIFHG